MGLRCKSCGSEAHIKNGFMRGKQRYRCKACGLNFTDTPPRGMPLALKATAVLLYVSGLSMNRTAKLLGVSTPTIQAWIEQFANVYAQKPAPEGRPAAMQPTQGRRMRSGGSRRRSSEGQQPIALGDDEASWPTVSAYVWAA